MVAPKSSRYLRYISQRLSENTGNCWSITCVLIGSSYTEKESPLQGSDVPLYQDIERMELPGVSLSGINEGSTFGVFQKEFTVNGLEKDHLDRVLEKMQPLSSQEDVFLIENPDYEISGVISFDDDGSGRPFYSTKDLADPEIASE